MTVIISLNRQENNKSFCQTLCCKKIYFKSFILNRPVGPDLAVLTLPNARSYSKTFYQSYFKMHLLRHIKVLFWTKLYIPSRYFYQLSCLSCLIYFFGILQSCTRTVDLQALELAMVKEEVNSRQSKIEKSNQ